MVGRFGEEDQLLPLDHSARSLVTTLTELSQLISEVLCITIYRTFNLTRCFERDVKLCNFTIRGIEGGRVRYRPIDCRLSNRV